MSSILTGSTSALCSHAGGMAKRASWSGSWTALRFRLVSRPGETCPTNLRPIIRWSDWYFSPMRSSAIAITLLVIEIEIPNLPKGASAANYGHELNSLIPSFAGFFMSFAVIARFWAAHHSAFSLADSYSRRMLPWNLVLLGMIALMPAWVTGFLSRNLNELVPTAVYFGVFTVHRFAEFTPGFPRYQRGRIGPGPDARGGAYYSQKVHRTCRRRGNGALPEFRPSRTPALHGAAGGASVDFVR